MTLFRKRLVRDIATATALATLAAAAVITTPVAAGAADQDTVSAGQVAAALRTTDLSDATLLAEPLKSRTDSDSAAVVDGSGLRTDVPRDPEDGVELGLPGAPSVRVEVPNADTAGTAKRLTDGTVVYPGDDGSASAVIPTENGTQMVTTIMNADAPTRYAYAVDVPEGGRVEVVDGNAFVVDDKGGLLLSVPAPWARDAEGAAVPTHFETDGATLTQVVDHRSATHAYPVVADPIWFVIPAWVLRSCGIGFLGAGASYWVGGGTSLWRFLASGAVGCVFGIIGKKF
ncbi:hypothetical protein [Streptomyces yangpuensis]|uniref:hypothetical protein n=1 Tax=Streptomyces yangpuensis TaxID=1648182 RepID=UPI00371F32A7